MDRVPVRGRGIPYRDFVCADLGQRRTGARSNDGLTWTTVDTRTGQTFAARFQTNNYMFTNGTAYPRYRLNVTANSGGPDLQLAELQLFGQ